MLTYRLDQSTRRNLQALVKANFASRDELYLAADALDDEDNRQVCRRLADQLASHAIHIQQVLAARGATVPGPPAARKSSATWRRAKQAGNTRVILEAAGKIEQSLKAVYERVAQDTPDQEATCIIDDQRREVEFGERVLRSLLNAKPRACACPATIGTTPYRASPGSNAGGKVKK